MDQLIFSSAVSGFYLLFPCNGGNCVLCGFNINQLCYIIFCRKAIGVCVGFMLPNSALQVAGHAGVKGHIGGACQDVYIVHAVLTPILSLPSQCAHWLWQSVLPVPCARVLRMNLLRCPKFLRCLTADAGNFDRGHSLTSLLLPLAALSSLPTTGLRTGLGMTRKFFRLSVIANRCAHRLWQSVSPVLCAGVLRIPTTVTSVTVSE